MIEESQENDLNHHLALTRKNSGGSDSEMKNLTTIQKTRANFNKYLNQFLKDFLEMFASIEAARHESKSDWSVSIRSILGIFDKNVNNSNLLAF